MTSHTHITLMGRVGNAPKQAEGTSVAFSMYVSHESGGHLVDTWYDVKADGDLVDCAYEIGEGALVLVEGEPRLRWWSAADGSPRARITVYASAVLEVKP